MNDGNATSRVEYLYALPFEKNFDVPGAIRSFTFLFRLACVSTPVYLLLVYAGQVYTRNRPAYHLRPALVLWNAALALTSTWGSLRVLPELFHVLKHFGFRYSVCVDNMEVANPVTAFWYYVFCLCKFLELGDTAFLVLRKKKVIFLHWFHHSSVLVHSFLTSEHRAVMGRWFACMNYTVHSLVYTYFAVRTAGWRLPRLVSLCVTVGQIAQMIVGLYVVLRVYLFWLLDEQPCSVTATSVNAAMALYSFYFYLFLDFFYRAYFKRSSLHSRAKTE